MPDINDAKRFFGQAQKLQQDLWNLVDSGSCSEVLYGWTLQRATELALKAWMRLLDIPIEKTHDLELLIEAIEPHAPAVSKYLDLAKHTRHAVSSVYEGMEFDEELFDRPAEAARVALLVQDVENRLRRTEQDG